MACKFSSVDLVQLLTPVHLIIKFGLQRMMSNRDYVYKRRYIIDEDQKVIIFVNQNTEHQSAPIKPGKQRVTEYWSIIVIKPLSDLEKVPSLKSQDLSSCTVKFHHFR